MQNNGQMALLGAAKMVGLNDAETVAATNAYNATRKVRAGEEGYLRPLPDVPWERMTGERSDAFMAFTNYRDMGVTRTLKGFADSVPEEMRKNVDRYGNVKTKTVRQFTKVAEKWSWRYRWKDRAQAWDDHIVDEWSKVRERSLMQQLTRHAEVANNFLGKIGERLNKMKPEDIPAPLIHLFYKTFFDVQMTALGARDKKTDEADENRAPTLVQVNIGDSAGDAHEIITPPLTQTDME